MGHVFARATRAGAASGAPTGENRVARALSFGVRARHRGGVFVIQLLWRGGAEFGAIWTGGSGLGADGDRRDAGFHRWICALVGAAVLALLGLAGLAAPADAQELADSDATAASPQADSPQDQSAILRPLPTLLETVHLMSTRGPAAPCVQPPPAVSWQDYQGPFAKTVGLFGRKLERKSVHPTHYKNGAMLCTLETRDKLELFIQDSLDPVTILSAAYDAGVSQAHNYDPSFGRGAMGYGHRFGADMADKASSAFFKDFAYPTIFSEDPRYYRLARGGFSKRLIYAMSRVVIAHRESDGAPMFNFSEWLGGASAVALSNVYHPDHTRGFDAAARRMGYGVTSDVGFNVLREFWPEIAHKLKLPFREQREGGTAATLAQVQASSLHQRQ